MESAIVELVDHIPDIVSDLDHLVLNVLNLALFGVDLLIALVNFFLQVCFGLLLLLGRHGVDLGMGLQLLIDVAVLLLDHIDFTV